MRSSRSIRHHLDCLYQKDRSLFNKVLEGGFMRMGLTFNVQSSGKSYAIA